MNKMIKGAAVAGLGVALLLGGGGTLAYWNADVEENAGQIVAGDLNLDAGDGVWVSSRADGVIKNINDYRVVPGENVTYTQTLDVTLEGDELEASLSLSGLQNGAAIAFADGTFKVTELEVRQGDNILDSTKLTEKNHGEVTASTTFEFLDSTDGRTSVNARYSFEDLTYQLAQNTN